ncbi:MAG: hypothetical protein KBA03_06645, partial [Anaerolineaceae bacterium]|nr:hypothetical protein [Anaerolineaceae bacterium]
KIQGKSETEIVEEALKRYQVDREKLISDLQNFNLQILNIINNPDQAPFITGTDFDSESTERASGLPLRVNLCLTDRDETNAHSKSEELSTENWKEIIRKTYDAGIPQVIFMGGEPVLRPDLIELLEFTEALGMVSGLLTSTDKLYEDESYLDRVLESGLDHLILEVNPEDEGVSSKLQKIFDKDLFTCIRFPVYYNSNLADWAITLVQNGCNALSFYAATLDANDRSAQLNQQLTAQNVLIEYDLPFPLKAAQSDQHVALFSPEIGPFESNLYTVMPDGMLCPQDFTAKPLGSLLSSNWNELIVK